MAYSNLTFISNKGDLPSIYWLRYHTFQLAQTLTEGEDTS